MGVENHGWMWTGVENRGEGGQDGGEQDALRGRTYVYAGGGGKEENGHGHGKLGRFGGLQEAPGGDYRRRPDGGATPDRRPARTCGTGCGGSDARARACGCVR
jgi:hypothetical protein